MYPNRKALISVPAPISFLPAVISYRNSTAFTITRKRAYVMPVLSESAMTMPLNGSLPRPDNLNMLIPIPRNKLPIAMTVKRRMPIFLK